MQVYGRLPFTSLRQQHRRQTRQRLFMLPKSPAGDVLSINGNSANAGDTDPVLPVEWKALYIFLKSRIGS